MFGWYEMFGIFHEDSSENLPAPHLNGYSKRKGKGTFDQFVERRTVCEHGIVFDVHVERTVKRRIWFKGTITQTSIWDL
uniref:Uncharacterized protein n=1 Tax=Caenorhabditis japonica TaxID=281687 RepID=A0A8R1I7Y9_CAEJA